MEELTRERSIYGDLLKKMFVGQFNFKDVGIATCLVYLGFVETWLIYISEQGTCENLEAIQHAAKEEFISAAYKEMFISAE